MNAPGTLDPARQRRIFVERDPLPELTREKFRAWVETRDPAESYAYGDVKGCPIASYLKSTGLRRFSVGSSSLYVQL